MMYKKYKFSSLVETIIDNRGRNPKAYYNKGPFPVIDNYLIKNSYYPDLSNAQRFLDCGLYKSFLRGYIQHQDVLMTLVGNGCGNVTLAPKDNAVIVQNTVGFRCNSSIASNIYIYYYFLSIKFCLKVLDRGSSQPSINRKDILKLNVLLPSLPFQQKIASILSTYDTLIENNTKRIRLLEQMAENLYKEWFVRFRFPGHENVEIEKGLPNGWKIEKVANWCRIFTGKKDVNQTKENGEYLFFSCSPNAYRSDEYIYDGKAILVAGNGSYTGRTRYYEGKFDLYQRTYAIVSNKEDNDFMFYLYNRFKFDFEPLHSGGTRGAAIPYIVMKDITRYTFLYNRTIVSLYIKHVKPMFKYIEYLQHQNQLLARQRDLLLPRLMSGKLEVKA